MLTIEFFGLSDAVADQVKELISHEHPEEANDAIVITHGRFNSTSVKDFTGIDASFVRVSSTDPRNHGKKIAKCIRQELHINVLLSRIYVF